MEGGAREHRRRAICPHRGRHASGGSQESGDPRGRSHGGLHGQGGKCVMVSVLPLWCSAGVSSCSIYDVDGSVDIIMCQLKKIIILFGGLASVDPPPPRSLFTRDHHMSVSCFPDNLPHLHALASLSRASVLTCVCFSFYGWCAEKSKGEG